MKERQKSPGKILFPIVFLFLTASLWSAQPEIIQPAGRLEAVPGPLTPGKPVLKFTMIDVWQGDSLFLELPSGRRVLIDTGSGSSSYASFDAPTIDILPFMKRNHIRSNDIQFFVATHPHSDHIGGAITMINKFKFPVVYDSGMAYTTENYLEMLKAIDRNGLKYIVPVKGQKLSWDPLCSVTVLNTASPRYSNPNNNSIVIRVVYGKFSILLTGDAEREVEEDMISDGAELASTVLKAGHHGSDTSSSDDFLDHVRPQAVFISVGLYNSYGHPVPSILDRYVRRKITVYRTDRDGDITLVTDGEHYQITTEKGIR
jgi:competence protein ComEC